MIRQIDRNQNPKCQDNSSLKPCLPSPCMPFGISIMLIKIVTQAFAETISGLQSMFLVQSGSVFSIRYTVINPFCGRPCRLYTSQTDHKPVKSIIWPL